MPELLELVDLFLFDIKHIDPSTHQQYVGVSNQQILENFSRILSSVGAQRIIPRIPLIPGFNTDSGLISQFIDYLRQLNYPGPIHLMPYNRLARTKWEKIGKGSLYRDMGTLTDETLDSIVKTFEASGFAVVCNA